MVIKKQKSLTINFIFILIYCLHDMLHRHDKFVSVQNICLESVNLSLLGTSYDHVLLV